MVFLAIPTFFLQKKKHTIEVLFFSPFTFEKSQGFQHQAELTFHHPPSAPAFVAEVPGSQKSRARACCRDPGDLRWDEAPSIERCVLMVYSG